MLCCAMLVLCCAVPCAVLCYNVPCHAMLCSAMLCGAVLCSAVLCRAVLSDKQSLMSDNTVHSSTTQHYTQLACAVITQDHCAGR